MIGCVYWLRMTIQYILHGGEYAYYAHAVYLTAHIVRSLDHGVSDWLLPWEYDIEVWSAWS